MRRPLLQGLEPRQLFATFTVTNTLDSGAGSLRAAIEQANASSTADLVQFNIPGSGAQTISLLSPLSITQPVTIDATTQPGFASAPLIRLNDANNVGAAINLVGSSNASVIRGLSITGFGNPATAGEGDAIVIAVPNARVERCYLGVRPDGVAAGNEGEGIVLLTGAAGAMIDANVISSNGGDGVYMSAPSATLTGNTIGLDPARGASRPNAGHGVHLISGTTTIGGAALADRNFISGNNLHGVNVVGPTAKLNAYNNYFGLSGAGNAKIANGGYGIRIASSGCNVGGTAALGNRFGGDGVLVTGNAVSTSINDNTFGIGVLPAFDVGDAYGINVDSGLDASVHRNTVGRLDVGVRLVGNGHFASDNLIGITSSEIAIPNTVGISTEGSSSEIKGGVVANNINFGIWVISGAGHVVDAPTFNNGQSIWVSTAANTNTASPTIMGLTETANGNYVASVALDLPAGDYSIVFYQSDQAGNAASGDTQTKLQSFAFTSDGTPDTSFYPLNAGQPLLDGKYLTVVATRTIGPQANAASQPSAARQAVGSPAVWKSAFEYESRQAWSFTFSENVGGSIAATDLVIYNTTLGVSYLPTAVAWDSATNTARWTSSSVLPDGMYETVLNSNTFTGSGGANKRSYTISTHVLAGDANRDRTVNFADLVILAQNYNQTGKTFSQGNFNYSTDGKVDFADLVLLAQRYNTSIGMPLSAQVAAPRSPSPTFAPAKKTSAGRLTELA